MDAGVPAPVDPGAHAVPVSVKGVAVQDGKVLALVDAVSAGELAITIFWTVHVPLAQIKSVKELPFGVKIKTVGSVYEFGGRTWYFRLLKGLLRIRTGFEGMERAVAQAVATVRAASSEDAEPEGAASQPGILIACLFLGGGLLALAVAVAVQPQAGVWLVHILAWLLRIYFDAGGFVVMLLGAWFLHNALRDRRDVRRLGLLTERNGSSHSTVR